MGKGFLQGRKARFLLQFCLCMPLFGTGGAGGDGLPPACLDRFFQLGGMPKGKEQAQETGKGLRHRQDPFRRGGKGAEEEDHVPISPKESIIRVVFARPANRLHPPGQIETEVLRRAGGTDSEGRQVDGKKLLIHEWNPPFQRGGTQWGKQPFEAYAAERLSGFFPLYHRQRAMTNLHI